MAKEVEHKYLVIDDGYKALATHYEDIVQAYIDRTPEHVVRIRRKGGKCYLTIKGKNHGDNRLEFEYQIPEEDFDQMLSLCSGKIIRKRRWMVPYKGFLWEVDEYEGEHKSLTVAEIELPESTCPYEVPPFIGANVTSDPRYYNSNL